MPTRRLVSLDTLRGISISAVLVLHCLQYTINEDVLEQNIQYSLPLYYVGGMSGLFFLISGLGNALALSHRFKTSPNKTPNKRRAQRQACCRGLSLIVIGYVSQIFVFRIWEDNFLMHYNRGGLSTTMATSEQISWVFTDRFTRNFIIESIGFVQIITSLVTIEVLDCRSKKNCCSTHSSVTKWMMIIVAGILVLNPLLRLMLDSVTCCVPERCSTYPSNDGFYTLASPPEINIPQNGTCIDNYNPCNFKDTKETFNSSVSRATRISPKDAINTSTFELRNEACINIWNQYGGRRDPKISLHGIPLGNVGRRWCGIEVGVGTNNVTSAVNICKLKPSWGRGTDFGPEELKVVGVGGAIGISLLQLFFGRFGFFAYGAPSIVGAAIGLYMERPERHVLLKTQKDRAIEPVLPWKCIRQTLAFCFGSFFIGFIIFIWLLLNGAEDSAMQASTHIRLFCGGGEVAIVLLSLSLIDFNGDLSWYYYVRDKCKCIRRCGLMTLTLWNLQWLNLIAVIIFDEIGGKQKPWKSKANGERTYQGNVLIVFLFVSPLWWLLSLFYEKIKFVGSLEWMMSKLIGSGSSKGGEKIIQVLNIAEPLYDEEDAYFGRRAESGGGRGDDVDIPIKTSCCQLCFCCCCCWKNQPLRLSSDTQVLPNDVNIEMSVS